MYIIRMYVCSTVAPDSNIRLPSSNSSLAGVYDTDAHSDSSIVEGRLVIRVGDEYANVYIFILQY